MIKKYDEIILNDKLFAFSDDLGLKNTNLTVEFKGDQ